MYKSIILVIAFLVTTGCAGVKQLKLEDVKNIKEISQNKAVVFLRMVPKNKDLYTSYIGLRRGALHKDGSASSRDFIDDPYYANLEPEGEFFVFIVEPMDITETWLVTHLNQKYKDKRNSEMFRGSYITGCGGMSGLDNIRISVNASGVYDLGVIYHEDYVSSVGEEFFKYEHSYDKESLNKYISDKFPQLRGIQPKQIEPKRFVNNRSCPGPQSVTIYM